MNGEVQTQVNQPLRLTVSREQAAAQIQRELKIARAIHNQRIANIQDLAVARNEKSEWVQRVHEMLLNLFNTPIVAEQCDDWQPIILPEYADFSLFVDVFCQELRHRMEGLKAVLRGLVQVPEPPPLHAETPAPPPAPPATQTSVTAPQASASSSSTPRPLAMKGKSPAHGERAGDMAKTGNIEPYRLAIELDDQVHVHFEGNVFRNGNAVHLRR